MYDIILFENLRFRSSTGTRKEAFSVTVFTGYVWTIGQTGDKNIRFQARADKALLCSLVGWPGIV